MSLETQLKHLNKLEKILFILNWIFETKGKNPIETIKIFNFKIFHLIMIFWLILKKNSMSDAINKTRDHFLKCNFTTIAKTKDNLLYKISNGEDLDIIRTSREYFVNKYFKPKKGDLVIDVGSNIGTYALKSALSVSDVGKVFAIEADPNTYQKLVDNIELNNFQNVIPINLAAYDSEKTLKLYKSDLSVSNSLIVDNKLGFVEVKTSTLDKIVEQFRISKINWIKIDVEGVELQVLNGAKKILTSNELIDL